MSKDRLEISLEDLGLDTATEKTVEKLVHLVVEKAISELGFSEQTIVKIPGTTAAIVDEKQMPKKKAKESRKKKEPSPSIRKKLEATGLDNDIKEFIAEELKDEIKDYHVRDIVKTCLNTKVRNLNPKSQKYLVNKCLENRNQINIRNSAESSTLLIKEGSRDITDIENWYIDLVRSIKNINEKLEMPKEIFELLNVEQKGNLKKLLGDLKIRLNRTIVTIKEK